MQCEEALNRLNARADGELPDDATELQAHLAECSQCRAAAEGLQAIDSDLRRAFVLRRNAATQLSERTIAAMRNSAVLPAPKAAPSSQSAYLAWAQLFVAAAAGFFLAIVVFRPWQSNQVARAPSLPIVPIAHLGVSSGPVEVQSPLQIKGFTCPTGSPIERDSIVRTGPTARCEIALENGNALRLDCDTEVTLRESKIVEVNRGRLCATSQPGSNGLEIKSAGGTVVAKPVAMLALDWQPHAARLIAVNGAVNVKSDGQSIDVAPGKQVHFVEGKLQSGSDWCDPILETSWVNSVLALSSSDHPELVERVNRLLANVGAAKLSIMYEDELRRLGDDGVAPLLAFLSSTRDKPNINERVTAAMIVADVAKSRWIADLIALLTDNNANVRFHAARGLERLTGRNQSLEAKAWKSESWASCEDAYQGWVKWWNENRDRYPDAKRELPAPTLHYQLKARN